jgi:phospholipase C
MDTRRDFIKKAALLAGAGSAFGVLPESIQRAFAIDPEPGTTCMDAEHVVILMQENRSFDHCFGTLRGVRGFNDPRAIRLANQNPVWLQTNARGETFAPFRLDIKETNATWMGSLPHTWESQVDARNHGRHDGWLEAKRPGYHAYSHMPLTLGYYTRQDLPFYYALADAFTICDQHFCSALTCTMPNRLYLWSGTVRGEQGDKGPAKMRNQDVEYESSASWKTFPERLEENNISWKIYQNELSSMPVGFTDEEDPWLSNYGDNPLEWFSQYHARFLPAHRAYLERAIAALPSEIAALQARQKALAASDVAMKEVSQKLEKAEQHLKSCKEQQAKWSLENFEKLSAREKSIYEKAFSTNTGDPSYHELASLNYHDGDAERQLEVPKGDVLHQFREDVSSGKLPAVSWLVAPENFSDHPSAAWYGAWYLSETLDILTQNPEVWKKTVFILTYDENDGYFDHIPPFVAPQPHQPETGLTSKNVPTDEDFVTLEEELKIKPADESRQSPIGLGYRVPMLIASPWSRGGYVCSQVFDHTSVLQFLEKFASHKSGRSVQETNISPWRRTVCGDLLSAFRPYAGEKIPLPEFVSKDSFLAGIHQAQFKKEPSDFKPLTDSEISQIKDGQKIAALLPRQEPGTRPSCGLPHEFYVDGKMNRAAQHFEITFAAGNQVFGDKAVGAPFNVYGWNHSAATNDGRLKAWAFAVAAGDQINYQWPMSAFGDAGYELEVYGPNGFFRQFKGSREDPDLEIECQRESGASARIKFVILNNSPDAAYSIEIVDNAYKSPGHSEVISAGTRRVIVLDTDAGSGWHDFSIRVAQNKVFEWRYAGRIETGKSGITDPAMA